MTSDAKQEIMHYKKIHSSFFHLTSKMCMFYKQVNCQTENLNKTKKEERNTQLFLEPVKSIQTAPYKEHFYE